MSFFRKVYRIVGTLGGGIGGTLVGGGFGGPAGVLVGGCIGAVVGYRASRPRTPQEKAWKARRWHQYIEGSKAAQIWKNNPGNPASPYHPHPHHHR